MADMGKTPPQSLRFGDAPYRHKDSIARVRNVYKPVLLFEGEDSTKYDTKIVEILGREFPQAQVNTLLGDHASNITSMKKFKEIFTSFIELNKQNVTSRRRG